MDGIDETKTKKKQPADYADTVFVIGCSILTVGLAAYSWKLALVLIGLALMIAGLVSSYNRKP